MSSPLPFVPFGNAPVLDEDQIIDLTFAIVAALKESVVNINLPEVASAGYSIVTGIIKGKFGILGTVSELVWAVANQDWEQVKIVIHDQIAGVLGIDDLLTIAEAIKAIDNGRAYVALMKNIHFKSALKKLD